MTVDLCLATYQGARHLPSLLTSLQGQSVRDWRLLIRDDGSTDGTRPLLARFAQKEPRVRLLEGGRRLGASDNFEAVLGASDADYVALVDQDDVWLPGKLASSLARMRALEARHGAVPLLTHTDAQVVDERLEVLAPSLWRWLGSDPAEATTLRRLLVQNVVPGCTMLCNRRLLDAAGRFPPEARHHDWWLILVARVRGQLGAVREPQLLYRQHGANAIGVEPLSLPRLALLSAKFRLKGWSAAAFPMRQAAALLRRHRAALSPADADFVAGFARLLGRSYASRLLGCLRLGVRQRSPRETLWFYLAV